MHTICCHRSNLGCIDELLGHYSIYSFNQLFIALTRMKKSSNNYATVLSLFNQWTQETSFRVSTSIVRPIELNPNIHSQLIHNSRYSRLFSTCRIVHSNASTVSTGGDMSTEKKTITTRIRRTGTRFSQAQKDLCDYFHSTRGYSLPDAEHLSKNTPVFLGKLVSKLKEDRSFDQSIGRLLRFHPINEFEPFLESIGLCPTKYKHLLPKNIIYLSDDPLLLENYHVLWSYGVPRIKIGRIYLESAEVFRYNEEVLLYKLKNYENFGISRAAIVKLVTCCPNLLVGEVNLNILRVYEKLSSLGVQFDLVIQCLSDRSKYNWSRVSEMLTFLDRMGFDKQALATLIKETPVFVFHESGKNIYLLVAILIKVGLKTDEILNLFVKNPRILIGNFVNILGHSVIFLTEIGMELGDIASIISTHPQILGTSPCRSSKSVLRHLSLPPKSLSDMIKADPSKFTSLACTRSVDEPVHIDEQLFLKAKTEFLLKLGFAECSDEMAKVVSKFRGRGDKLQERFDCLVNSGLDYHDVVKMIKMAPAVLNQSTDVLIEKIDYLTNKLDYPLESLVDFPSFLCYNMDRARLRFEMVSWLTDEKGLVTNTRGATKRSGGKFSLSYVLASSEKRFLKHFVDVKPKGKKHYEMLKKSILGSKGIAN
ncbi:transcription termination factor MTEF18, mitochondrial-like isoform X1 [Carex rostrata]